MDWGRNWFADFKAGKNQLFWFDWSNNTGAIDVKWDASVLQVNSYFKMLGLTYFSKLECGPYITSIPKTASKKIAALNCSVKSLFS